MNLAQLEAKLNQHPRSPLFARLAEEHLAAERVKDAKELCLSGLQKYPGYLTAQVILAKCYAEEQQIDKAIQLIGQVSGAFPGATALQALLAQLKALPASQQSAPPAEGQAVQVVAAAESPAAIEQAPVVVDTPVVEKIPEPSPAPQVSEISVKESRPLESSEMERPPVAEAPLPGGQWVGSGPAPTVPEEPAGPAKPESKPLSDESRIVSKTLAEIYVEQNQFVEAIRTYQLLKKQKPELTGEIDKRIKELEIKLQVRQVEFGNLLPS
ncbi:MAG: tetratricopeptide repeat protein [Bacteroidota bacterium]|jgi:predicted Zn-dependent protease